MIVRGVVEKGAGLGKKEFVPTINLMLESIPNDLEFGIYACKLNVRDQEYFGVVHYGKRTTIDDLVTFEVNIFDFNESVYGETVEVEVLDKIRDIVKFENKEELQKQIEQDIVEAKEILNSKS